MARLVRVYHHRLDNFIPTLLVVAMLAAVLSACATGQDDAVRDATPPSSSTKLSTAPALETTVTRSSGDAQTATLASFATAPSGPSPAATESGPGGTPTPPQPPPPSSGTNAVTLLAQGFSQAEGSDEIGWGFVIENRDMARALFGSSFALTVYDASGIPLETQDGMLDVLLPGQRLGVGGSLFLPPDATADRIEVVIAHGEAAEPELDPRLTIDSASYYADDLYPTATGVVHSDFDRPLEDIQVYAVAYDSAGLIVGGGSGFLSFVLPDEPAGVEVVVTAAGAPASVELFPMITNLTRYADQMRDDPRAARPLFIDEQGFGALEAQHVGWGFIIQNPNQDMAVESIDYQVVAWTADGNVLGTSAATLAFMLPGQRFGVGGELFLPDGPIVDRLSFQVLQRAFIDTDLEPGYLTVDDTEVESGPSGLAARGTLTNDGDEDLSSVDIYAIAYDASGAISGGGSTVLDGIERGGSYRVAVPLVSLGEPERVEVFAVPS